MLKTIKPSQEWSPSIEQDIPKIIQIFICTIIYCIYESCGSKPWIRPNVCKFHMIKGWRFWLLLSNKFFLRLEQFKNLEVKVIITFQNVFVKLTFFQGLDPIYKKKFKMKNLDLDLYQITWIWYFNSQLKCHRKKRQTMLFIFA